MKSHHKVKITFEFIARNPNPQYQVRPEAYAQCIYDVLKKNSKWFQELADHTLALDTANKTGLLQKDWFPDGSLHDVLVEVSPAGSYEEVMSKKPRWLQRLLRFFP